MDKVIHNKSLPHINIDFRIAAAILNLYFSPIESDKGNESLIIIQIRDRENTQNNLEAIVDEYKLDTKRSLFRKIDECHSINFPTLSLENLYKLTLGSYQLKQSLSYIAQHLDDNGNYVLKVAVEKITGNDLIRAKLLSRHSGKLKYNIYVMYDMNKTEYEAILGYMCRCKNGLRTLGCCAHIASVIYYLSYGRHQETFKKPGEFLTGLFPHAQPIIIESSDEEDEQTEDSREPEEQN